MNKKIEEGGYKEFIEEYFPKNFPTLRAKFPYPIDWSMSKAPYCTRKPHDMSVEDFDQFRFIEHEWLQNEGYLPKDENNPSFVNMVGGITYIPLPYVEFKSIIKIDEKHTNIDLISLVDNTPHSYSVVGNIDYVNKRLRIV